MNIYVGNLAYGVTDADLHALFSASGEVSAASVIMDKMTGQSKGFGFVEMPNRSEAHAAIGALNGEELKGRAINVNEARPRTEGQNGRGGYRRGRGGYRGRRGGNRSSQQVD